jgi:hypothetical protein
LLTEIGEANVLSKDRQADVDQEISTASALEEDTERWQNDGKNDLADIAVHIVTFLRL